MEFPLELSFILLCVTIFFLIYYPFKGYRNGFILEAIKTVTLLLCVIFGWFFSGVLKSAVMLAPADVVSTGVEIVDQTFREALNQGILFVIIFVISYIVLFLCRRFLKKLNNISIVGWVNKLLGSLLAFLKALVYVVLLIVVISSPIFTNGSAALQKAGLKPVKTLIKSNVPVVGDLIVTFEKIEEFRNSGIIDEYYQELLEGIQDHSGE